MTLHGSDIMVKGYTSYSSSCVGSHSKAVSADSSVGSLNLENILPTRQESDSAMKNKMLWNSPSNLEKLLCYRSRHSTIISSVSQMGSKPVALTAKPTEMIVAPTTS